MLSWIEPVASRGWGRVGPTAVGAGGGEDPPTDIPGVRLRHDLLGSACECDRELGEREGCGRWLGERGGCGPELEMREGCGPWLGEREGCGGQQRRCQGRQKRNGNRHNVNRDVLKYTEKKGFGYVSSLNSFWNGKKAVATDNCQFAPLVSGVLPRRGRQRRPISRPPPPGHTARGQAGARYCTDGLRTPHSALSRFAPPSSPSWTPPQTSYGWTRETARIRSVRLPSKQADTTLLRVKRVHLRSYIRFAARERGCATHGSHTWCMCPVHEDDLTC